MAKPSIAQTDFTGQRFGRLIAVRRAAHPHWLCLCDCGREVEPTIYALLSGNTRSCGCLHRETAAEVGLSNAKHGEAKKGRLTPEYRTWSGMRNRCEVPSMTGFENYGGRGITICARWRDNYETFLADMGRKPSPKHSIEWLDNNRGYEPGNCVWATLTEQANNRRSCVILRWDGRAMTITEWARRLGLPSSALHQRLRKGWTVERALTQPLRVTG